MGRLAAVNAIFCFDSYGEHIMSDSSTTHGSKGLIAQLFTDHPATVDETYFGHMRFALWFAF